MLAFELSLIDQKEPTMQRSEGIAHAKAQGQGGTWHVGRTGGRPLRLEPSEGGALCCHR